MQTEIPERFGSTRSTADLLLERKSFNLPPYSRLIDIRISGLTPGVQSSALPNNGVEASGLATALPNNGVSTGESSAQPNTGVEARSDRLRNRLTSQFGRCDCLSPAPGPITLRITLPRDKQLTNNKLQLARILQDAERQFGRTLRIIPDVDPL